MWQPPPLSRPLKISNMEGFVIIVNGCKPLIVVKKLHSYMFAGVQAIALVSEIMTKKHATYNVRTKEKSHLALLPLEWESRDERRNPNKTHLTLL